MAHFDVAMNDRLKQQLQEECVSEVNEHGEIEKKIKCTKNNFKIHTQQQKRVVKIENYEVESKKKKKKKYLC